MYKGLGLLNADPPIDLRVEPRLRLLLELEPRYRVFFSNLFDRLLFRTVPRMQITWKPARWDGIFVPTGLPWWALLESMFWHAFFVAAVVALTPQWLARRQVVPGRPTLRRSGIVYYPPSRTFSTVGSARPREEARAKARATSPQNVLKVARERSQSNVAAPNVKMGKSRLPDLGSAKPALPAVPASAVSRSLTLPADLASAIAPPPEITTHSGSTRPGMSGPAVAAVAPPPELTSDRRARRGVAGGFGGGASVVPPPPAIVRSAVGGAGVISSAGRGGIQVVPPPPSLQGAAGAGGRGAGNSLASTQYAVVAPPPALNGTGLAGRSGTDDLSGGGLQVVPPPPDVGRGDGYGGAKAGSGRGGSSTGIGPGSLANASVQVVPPPPSLDGTGGGNGMGRGRSPGAGFGNGAGSQVVQPMPSLSEISGSGGRGRGSGAGSGPLGGGIQVVPPPPTLGGTGGSGGNGRGGSLYGSSTQAVPPPPSLAGAGDGGGGRGGSLASGGGAVGPAVTAGLSGAGGRPVAADIPPTSVAQPPPATLDNGHPPAPQELPIRVIGIAFALPGSSYFSNYEVFIAERRVGKDQTQLIKLVYVFLPYQQRLSEIGFNPAGVHKLRVIRDHSCDETLLQMTWRPGQPRPSAQDLAKYAAQNPGEQGAPLPCYRTTADDYQKATSHSR